MADRILRSDRDGGLCVLTLNRPDKLNALDTLAFEELDAHLAELEQQTDRIGCVVVHGAGRGFCAGADLEVLGKTAVTPTFKPRVIERLGDLPQPVIAAVHGVCYTGGLELALACDFIVADTAARFADTHGKWGLVGAWGMSQRLPRKVGQANAKRLMMTAEEVAGAAAHAMGLVDVLAEEGQLMAETERLAEAVLANSWHTNRAVKQLLTDTEGMSLAEGLAHEHYRSPGNAPDYRERIAHFSKRR